MVNHLPCYTVPPMARQRLGQHFLGDLHWREEIARAIRVSPHSTVPRPPDDQHCWIEIGSGHGEMTQHLLAAGTPVHAIEIDPAFLPGLRHLAKQFPSLTVIPGDILEADIAAIAAGRRLRIYGDRKSTRLNSSHGYISYAVFCLKKKEITSLLLSSYHSV